MNGPGAEGLPPLPAYAEEDPSEPRSFDNSDLVFYRSAVEAWRIAEREHVPSHRRPNLAGYAAEVIPDMADKIEILRDEVVKLAALLAAARCPSCRPVGGGYCQTCGRPL